MILILEMIETSLGNQLRSVLQKQGEKTLLLTASQLTQEVSISFSLNTHTTSFSLRYQDICIQSDALKGVYCGVTSFLPSQFPRFSPEDARYAALETQALWLAMLSSLTCPLINPPALDTLAGSMLSPVELAEHARKLGFKTPFMVCVESGETAAQIYQSSISARFSDLGKPWINENNWSQIGLDMLSQNPNHFLIQENPPGLPIGIGVVGKHLLAYEIINDTKFKKLEYSKIPGNIRSKIRKLQKDLHLNAAEYLFKYHHGEWMLCTVTNPLHFTLQAYPEDAYAALAAFLSE